MVSSYIQNAVRQINAGTLFGLLAFFLIALPWLDSMEVGRSALVLGHTFVFIVALLANRERPVIFKIGIAVVAATIGISWLNRAAPSHELRMVSSLMGAFILGTTAFMLLFTIFEETSNRSAILRTLCVYLLIGTAWAQLYATLEEHDPDAFNYPQSIGGQPTFETHVYLSFVTMTTLGFGDIRPETPVARMLTWVQSVLGQFYLAVLVARLVNIIPQRSASSR